MAHEILPLKLGFTNCYLIKGDSTILIDAGGPGMIRKFHRNLERLSMRPTDIDFIIVTHGHWDHIGSAKEIKDASGAKIMISEEDSKLLEEARVVIPPAVTAWGKVLTFLGKGISAAISFKPTHADALIQEEDLSLKPFGLDGKILKTPGHTEGSLSVLLDTGQAFVGDLAMNGFPLTRGPKYPIFADDVARVKQSWDRLIEQGAKTVYPSHGRPFSIQDLSV